MSYDRGRRNAPRKVQAHREPRHRCLVLLSEEVAQNGRVMFTQFVEYPDAFVGVLEPQFVRSVLEVGEVLLERQ